MAARAMGSGTISFGLVSIPVKLFSTSQSQAQLSFNLLHKKCGGRLKQQYICPQDQNQVVERDDMVKGYEFAKDQYVTFTPEEIKALEEQGSEAIDITEFVRAETVDPVYFEKAYYLGPDKGAEKAYRLLIEAMRDTGRCALARYAARGKQYLVMLRPIAGDKPGLVMQNLRYADEVKSFDEVVVPDAAVKDGELKLAKQIIDQIASETFNPGAYEDDVKKRTNELIQKKIEGEEIRVAPGEAPQAKIIDLMEALKASLGAKPAAAGGVEPRDQAARRPARRSEDAAPAKLAKSRK